MENNRTPETPEEMAKEWASQWSQPMSIAASETSYIAGHTAATEAFKLKLIAKSIAYSELSDNQLLTKKQIADYESRRNEINKIIKLF